MGDAAILPSSQRREPGSFNPLIATWPPTAATLSVDSEEVAADIINRFNQAIGKKDFQTVASLFHEDGYWRDHLALSWDFHTMKGRDAIVARLERDCPLVEVGVDRTTDWKSPKLFPFDTFGKVQGIQFYTNLSTKVGTGRGIVRVSEKNGQWKIWTFYTSLTAIDGHEEPIGPRRSRGVQHGANPERKNWKDRRNQEIEFVDNEPDVLIVGKFWTASGQSSRSTLTVARCRTSWADSTRPAKDAQRADPDHRPERRGGRQLAKAVPSAGSPRPCLVRPLA
jgi:hypothetical protein